MTIQSDNIFKELSKIIKNPKSDLKYRSKFTLLVSVVLSAQCTDVNVNNVTKDIYPLYNTPEDFVKLGQKKIEKLIKRKISFYLGHQKAFTIFLNFSSKNIKAKSLMILINYLLFQVLAEKLLMLCLMKDLESLLLL